MIIKFTVILARKKVLHGSIYPFSSMPFHWLFQVLSCQLLHLFFGGEGGLGVVVQGGEIPKVMWLFKRLAHQPCSLRFKCQTPPSVVPRVGFHGMQFFLGPCTEMTLSLFGKLPILTLAVMQEEPLKRDEASLRSMQFHSVWVFPCPLKKGRQAQWKKLLGQSRDWEVYKGLFSLLYHLCCKFFSLKNCVSNVLMSFKHVMF